MGLTSSQKTAIEDIIVNCVRKKLLEYKPESNSMPFHYRLLGRDGMALFSFIHSLNTTFGSSIFEPVAEILAKYNHPIAINQYEVGKVISSKAQEVIQGIINKLSLGALPNKKKEIEMIRSVCTSGKMETLKTVKVDLFVKSNDGNIHFFDIKTAKPNISNFKDYKRTLLEWVAIF